ncbi:MAG: hypothetical protein IJ896_06305 [Fibrobacter sp.]|nr:hypothetical protein [Fibrobacter sp.]
MWKKSICGLTALVAGLLIWSCGDGSVDSLNDNELMMISRFPSTIDYDMLDRVVEDCKRDQACWDKALKTGEIYQGDYTKVLRDSSGNIVVVEGDSAYIWKDGKKLPVFDFSSNSVGDEDDDVPSSSGSTSGSSSKSSGSGYGYSADAYTDVYGDSSDSGSGKSSVARATTGSSGSQSTGNSSSIDMSVLNSSSSEKVASATSASIDTGISSEKIEISVNSEPESSSSEEVVEISSSSIGQHGGGGGSDVDYPCLGYVVPGTCQVASIVGYVKEPVTYTFTPSKDNTCTAYDKVEWFVTETEGASPYYWKDPSTTKKDSYSFEVTFTTLGVKHIRFSMGGGNVDCPQTVEIKRRCEKNSYSCTRSAPNPRKNIWSPNGVTPVSYTWTLNKLDGSCLDVKTRTWGGAVSGTGETVTKSFSTEINAPVYVDVEDELGNVDHVVCDGNAEAVSEPEVAPTCDVADLTWPVDYPLAVTPTVTGCDYSVFNTDKCTYSLAKTGGSELVGGTKYVSGALKSIDGESTAGTVEYALTMTNYRGSNECSFEVNYVVPEVVTFNHGTSKSFESGAIYAITYSKTGSALVCPANHPAFECNGILYSASPNTHTAVNNPSSDCKILKVVGNGTLSCQFTW